MCYLVAKKRLGHGCIAFKTNRGKDLVGFIRNMNKKVIDKNIQIITISRPSAYNEYAPYRIVENKDIFEKEIETLK